MSSSKWQRRCNDVFNIMNREKLCNFIDVEELGLRSEEKEDYKKKVGSIMTKSIIKKKLHDGVYNKRQEFYNDFHLFFDNAIKYSKIAKDELGMGVGRYLKKKFDKEWKNKFDRSNTRCNSERAAELYARYIRLLTERPKMKESDHKEIADINKLGKNFAIPSRTILSEELNEIMKKSNKEDYEELCRILNIEKDEKDKSIEIAELKPNVVESLWAFVKKHQK